MLRHLTSIALFVLLLAPSMLLAQSRILVVHSYHAGYEWTDSIQIGIDHALVGRSYNVKIMYMDTKRHTDEAWKVQAGKRAMQQVATFKPDIVITTDDNAQKYFAQALSKQPDSPQIVFCGVNAPLKEYGYPNANATGFLGRSHLTATLKLAMALKPKIKRVTFISDDGISSRNAYDYYKTLSMPMKVVNYVNVSNFAQWQSAVLKANQNSDVILVTMYHTIKHASNDPMSMEPSEVMQWTLTNSKLPILGVYPFTVKDGAMLGICSSGKEHGYMAAVTPIDMITTGRTALRYPINTSIEGSIMFNIDAIRQHKLKIPKSLGNLAQLVDTNKPKKQTASVDPDME